MTSRRQQPQLALPTAAKLDILAVLWKLGVATVREVHDELGKDHRYTTTLKTMQLMTEKGLLTRSERFGSHVYEPGIPKEQTQRQIAGDLLKRGLRRVREKPADGLPGCEAGLARRTGRNPRHAGLLC